MTTDEAWAVLADPDTGQPYSPTVWTDRQFRPTGEITAAELARRARGVGFTEEAITNALAALKVRAAENEAGAQVLTLPDLAGLNMSDTSEATRRLARGFDLSPQNNVRLREALAELNLGAIDGLALLTAGKLKVRKIDGQPMVARSELDALLRARRRRSDPTPPNALKTEQAPEPSRPRRTRRPRPSWMDAAS